MKEKSQHNKLFRQLMTSTGVQPLKESSLIVNHQATHKSKNGKKIQQSSISETHKLRQISTLLPTLTTSEQILFYHKRNIARHLLELLDQTPFPANIFLDLHGFTVNQAVIAMNTLLDEVTENKFSLFTISHGIGRRSKDGIPLLKSYVNQWLKDSGEVIAFASAKRSEGGPGVVNCLTVFVED